MVPTFRLSQWDVSYPNPSGISNTTLTASGYIRQLGQSAAGALNFGSVNNANGSVTSTTYAVVGNVDNFGGVGGATEAIYNMRFWIQDYSAFSTGTVYFNTYISGVWRENFSLTSASGLYAETTLPSGQNVKRQDYELEITGSGTAKQATQWIFLSVTVDTDVPAGVYGGANTGFNYRMTYDYR